MPPRDPKPANSRRKSKLKLDLPEPELAEMLHQYRDLRRRGFTQQAILTKSGWTKNHQNLLLEEAQRREMPSSQGSQEQAVTEWLLEMYDAGAELRVIQRASALSNLQTKNRLEAALESWPETDRIMARGYTPGNQGWRSSAMLGKRSDQKGLWEADRLYLDYVGKDTFYGLLASLRGQLFSDDDFAEIYCPDNGRDSVPPSLLATALLLQTYDKVSDAEAKARADFDIRWKVALGIEIEDRPFAKSTLQLFRAQLILHDKVREVFESSLRLARQSGYLKKRGMQVALDTTYTLGRGAVPTGAACCQGNGKYALSGWF